VQYPDPMFYFFNQETVPTDTRVRKNFHQL